MLSTVLSYSAVTQPPESQIQGCRETGEREMTKRMECGSTEWGRKGSSALGFQRPVSLWLRKEPSLLLNHLTNHHILFYMVVSVKILKYLYQSFQFFSRLGISEWLAFFIESYYKLVFLKASLHCNIVPVGNFEVSLKNSLNFAPSLSLSQPGCCW